MSWPNSGTQFIVGNSTFVKALAITNANPATFATNAQTQVDKFQGGTLTAGGNNVRLTLQGSSAGTCKITACYIGNASATGNAYNFDGGQVQVLFGGSVSTTIAVGTGNLVPSDTTSFTINPASTILIAFNYAGTTSFEYASGLGTHYTRFNHLGSEAASTVKTTSYTANGGQSATVALIEVF